MNVLLYMGFIDMRKLRLFGHMSNCSSCVFLSCICSLPEGEEEEEEEEEGNVSLLILCCAQLRLVPLRRE